MIKRWGWLWSVLLLVSLACTVTRQPADPGATDTGGEVADSGSVIVEGPPPTVQIISPQNGQQVMLGTDVEIQVSASDSVGITMMQLLVANRISSTQSFPEPDREPQAILRWRPDRRGTFELSVIAFSRRGSELVPSTPVMLSLEVVGRGDPITNPVSGQPNSTVSAGGECVIRVLISNLRVRTGPGTNFEREGFYDLNEQLTALGKNYDSQNSEWFKVRRINGEERWVINNPGWVETTGDCANAAVVE